MVILAQDPSFKSLASSLYDGKDTIYVHRCSYPLGTSIGFDTIYTACHDLRNQYIGKLNKVVREQNIQIDKVFSEYPPPISQFSSGLYALDTFVLSELWSAYSSISEMYIIPPSYLSMVHGTSKYKKSDSTKLAKYFFDEVLVDKFKLCIEDTISEKGRRSKGVINNDKAESLIFLLRAFCKYDVKGCRDLIVSEMGGLGYSTEKLLVSR